MSKKKVIESTNNSTSSIDPNSIVIYHYKDVRDLRLKPVTQRTIDGISENLLNWSRLSDSMHMDDFEYDYGYPISKIYEWKEKFPELAESLAIALKNLCRNRRNAINRIDKESKFVYRDHRLAHVQHIYDPQWAEANKYHAELKAQQDKEDASSLGYQMFLDYQAKAKEMKKKD